MRLDKIGFFLEKGEYARREAWVPQMYIRKLGNTNNIEFIIIGDEDTLWVRDKWSPRIEDLNAKDYTCISHGSIH